MYISTYLLVYLDMKVVSFLYELHLHGKLSNLFYAFSETKLLVQTCKWKVERTANNVPFLVKMNKNWRLTLLGLFSKPTYKAKSKTALLCTYSRFQRKRKVNSSFAVKIYAEEKKSNPDVRSTQTGRKKISYFCTHCVKNRNKDSFSNIATICVVVHIG